MVDEWEEHDEVYCLLTDQHNDSILNNNTIIKVYSSPSLETPLHVTDHF